MKAIGRGGGAMVAISGFRSVQHSLVAVAQYDALLLANCKKVAWYRWPCRLIGTQQASLGHQVARAGPVDLAAGGTLPDAKGTGLIRRSGLNCGERPDRPGRTVAA